MAYLYCHLAGRSCADVRGLSEFKESEVLNGGFNKSQKIHPLPLNVVEMAKRGVMST